MNRRAMVCVIMVLAVFSIGCEQIEALADLKNNKSRIKGTWKKYEGGFPSDHTYSFNGGIIKEDDFAYGTYKFPKSDLIDVALGDKVGIYQVEFKNDDREMVWFEMLDGKRYDRLSWRR